MKAWPLLFAASLVVNAVLVTTMVWRKSDSARGTARPKTTAPSGSSARAKPGAMSSEALVAALNANNPESLRDLLRAAGLSDDLVRAFVQMSLWKNYEARFKALQPQPDPNKPWWKDDRSQQNGFFGNLTKAQRDEMRRLQHEVRDEQERLLGPDKNGNGYGWQDPRLSFLAADKRKELQQVQQDYQELIGEVQQDMQGFRLPSDSEKLRFLQEEQKRDIEALMTPEERQAYELRMSPTAQQLRWKMTQIDASEEEYLKIFPLQKAFDDTYNQRANDPYGNNDNSDRTDAYWKARNAAEKQLQDQIKAVVGEPRYAESIKLQDGDYQQLEAATRRLALPADTAARVYALRDNVAASAQQIADNANLAVDQKKEALAALASATRDQVRASLGTEGADAYFKNNGMGWLKEVEKGNVVTFNKGSNGWNTKALPKEPKKAATPK